MNNLLRCPRCGLGHIKRNGYTHYGKQNYQGLGGSRQFGADSQHIAEATREVIKRLRLERLSLCGICRVMEVSWRGFLDCIAKRDEALPDDLHVRLPRRLNRRVKWFRLQAEADELWRFVGRKANKQGVWIALDTQRRQVIAFYVGDRSRRSVRRRWNRIPALYRQHATFDTDDWEAYQGVIPQAQHRVCVKGSGHTHSGERFNCTLRQRVSRLVRDSLSFSKILRHPIGAIKYFICHYTSDHRRCLTSITFP